LAVGFSLGRIRVNIRWPAVAMGAFTIFVDARIVFDHLTA
jgi:hypothetical protein